VFSFREDSAVIGAALTMLPCLPRKTPLWFFSQLTSFLGA
jgi:hypothetical protein